MCASCGWGKLNEETPEQTTIEDLERAAQAQGISVGEVVHNLRDAYERSRS